MQLKLELFTFLFLSLGPFKIIGPFVKVTRNATPALTRQIAIRATLYSSAAILIAATLGEQILSKYSIPLPILALSAGIILFLVALLEVIKQFEAPIARTDSDVAPTLNMALNPIAFPTIVTPYGIAAVIVFLAICPDMNCRLRVIAILAGIMLLNLIVMLIAKHVLKPLALILPILGAVLGIVQVALGLLIIHSSVKELLKI